MQKGVERLKGEYAGPLPVGDQLNQPFDAINVVGFVFGTTPQ